MRERKGEEEPRTDGRHCIRLNMRECVCDAEMPRGRQAKVKTPFDCRSGVLRRYNSAAVGRKEERLGGDGQPASPPTPLQRPAC